MNRGATDRNNPHPDRERAPTPRARPLDELGRGIGPPLTTAELAKMVGMSATFIRDEIHGGHIRAVVVGRGRKRVYRIPAREAYRYMKELGIL